MNRGKFVGPRALTKKHPFDAGLDICADENVIIPAGGRELVSTSLRVAVPDGCVGLLWSRSGLSLKHGIEVGAGCIDSSYRGEVRVLLYNHGSSNFQVTKGDRIAQLLTIPIFLEEYEKVSSLEDTDRGGLGFGSTGVGEKYE